MMADGEQSPVAPDAKQRLAAMTAEQKRLLAQRLSRRRPASDGSIPRRADPLAVAPLSFAQQRFWFLSQLGGASTAYNCTELHRLRGPLDVAALERSLNEIVRRHTVLRTRFEVTDGVPQQRIVDAVHVPVPVDDLRGGAAAASDAARRSAIADEARRPWSLSDGPPIRARVWQLAADDHQLMVVMHHIVADGWSQGVLIRELAALYEAFSNGRPSPLPDLPIQYADFAVWQHDWVKSPEFTQQLEYWRVAMREPPVLQLPAIRSQAGGPGTHKRFFLSRELGGRVRALCKQEGVTVFMAMLAAFATLLSRYSGQDDVVIGAPVANRDRAETEGLIGSFMNPLPVRLDLRGNPSFRTLLARARESALGAFANQNVPFDVLVRSLHTARDGAGAPLFQAMFLMQNFGAQSLQVSGGALSSRAVESQHDVALPPDYEMPGDLLYPVALEMVEVGNAVGGSFEYAAEYAATTSRFPDHLRRLLAAVVDDPDVRVGAVPFLSEEERQLVLHQWNHETAPLDAVSAAQLFEAEAAAHPEATAVIAGDHIATYRELNDRANAIAGRLIELGVGPEVCVGILLERSVDMVASVLGVMKAGGAYVPLDPGHPVDRLRYVAADAGLRVLVTSDSLVGRLPEIAGDRTATYQILSLDRLGPSTNAGNVNGGAVPGSLAYVIYTSGSTGMPKGTMVTHGSLVNAFRAWECAYDLRDLRVHLQLASLSFDVCTGDLVRALCAGAALVIVPQEALFAPAQLLALMRRHGVDAAEFVPVVLRELVKHVEETGQSLSFMRLLVAGSDSWYVHEYERIRQLCGPTTRLINSYGLTETTIDSTFFDGTGQISADDGLVPLGRAFANTEIVLLDRYLQPVPIGVTAELCIAGPPLARGYLRRPDLTAERFVPHPFSTQAGARLYRTGDLARYLPDGTLELLGRVDTQVKLRGFRIELAEIESVLRAHPLVRDAVVVLREDRPNDRRLVAYVVPSGEVAASIASELRRSVREALPEYMVPTAIMTLAALPLTSSGKIDRNALPAPDGERLLDEAFVAPATALERKLATVWCDLLRVEQVGVHDNFFDLGGHSLLLIQLHARLAPVVEGEVSVLDLFRFPTIRTLAAHLSAPPAQTPAFAGVQQRAERQRAAVQARRRQAAQARDGRESE